MSDEAQQTFAENLARETQSMIPEIMRRLRDDHLDRISRSCLEEVTRVATVAARDWATTQLVPEMKAQLEASKDGMISAAAKFADDLSSALAAAMVEQATKSLSSSHLIKDIAEKIFRGY